METTKELLQDIYDQLIKDQVALAVEAQQVLYENLWELYIE